MKKEYGALSVLGGRLGILYTTRVISPNESAAPEPMKYVMLGEDHSTTAEKLAKYTGPAAWNYLRPHQESGSLFFVDPVLKLEDVGASFAHNERSRVEAWLKSGEIVKIGELHAAQWEGTDIEFEALVVSPFVLCRPI